LRPLDIALGRVLERDFDERSTVVVNEFHALLPHNVHHPGIAEYVRGLRGARATTDDERARLVLLDRTKNGAKGIGVRYRRHIVCGRPGFVGLYRDNLTLEKWTQRQVSQRFVDRAINIFSIASDYNSRHKVTFPSVVSRAARARCKS